jgi:hypothetical protein
VVLSHGDFQSEDGTCEKTSARWDIMQQEITEKIQIKGLIHPELHRDKRCSFQK